MVQANSFLNFFKQLLRGAGPALRPLPCRPPQQALDSARQATRDLGEAVWPQAGADSENGPRAESKASAGSNRLRRRWQECARGPRGWRPAPPPRPGPRLAVKAAGTSSVRRAPGPSCGSQARQQGAGGGRMGPDAARWGRGRDGLATGPPGASDLPRQRGDPDGRGCPGPGSSTSHARHR